jgi:hypothetical protein
MARVAGTLEADEAGETPILASPRLGVERAVEQLGRFDEPSQSLN